MKRVFATAVALVLLCGLSMSCKKNTPVIPADPGPRTPADTTPPPPDVAAPTIDISASPTAVDRRGPTTLTWTSTNASAVVIDNGVGNVNPNGSITVSPVESITYTARATGRGGEASDSVRITVRQRTPVITDQDIPEKWAALERSGDIGPIFFAYDKAELSADAKAQLERNAASFRNNPDFGTIVIEGHCDERGTEEYNLALGDRRAQAARDYLVQLGVSGSRLQTISFGEERPFDPGHSEAAWRLNRRAHFVLQR